MKLTRKNSLLLLGAIVITAIASIAWWQILGWHRPYVNWAPWDLAQYLMDNERDPQECLDLISFEIMAPQQGEQRALCIFEYAKIAKDPLACELLMPSSYRLDCVGAAEDFEPCVMLADDKQTVKGEGIETTFSKCETGQKEIGDHVCCKMAKVLFTENNDCENFPNGPLKDQCNHIVAVRTENLELCAAIENERNRKGCEVIVRGYKAEKFR